VRELIEDPDRTKHLPDAIAQGSVTQGMQTFDQSLMQLFARSLITADEATRRATNPADFALRLSGVTSTSDSRWDNFDGTGGTERAPATPPPPEPPSPPDPSAPMPKLAPRSNAFRRK
jgi:twitching motility protein PilT